MRTLEQRNAIYKAGGADGPDPRIGRPKKRTIWPGQHIYCGICGRLYRYGGHGQNDHLLCRGACEYRCWNAITVEGPLAAQKLSAAILAEIESLPDFDQVFYDLAAKELQQSNESRSKRLSQTCQQVGQVEREMDNLVRFVREGRRTERLHEELQTLEARHDTLILQKKAIEEESCDLGLLPDIDALKQLARQQMALQAEAPFEFGRVMRQLINRIVVFPYRLCDGGGIVLRAGFRLNLTSLLPPSQRLEALDKVLHRQLTVDLFEPPQRAFYRQQVSAKKAEEVEGGPRKTLDAIALELGITKTAVQKAAALDRMMKDRSLIDPYVPVTSLPDDFTKLRRHKHPRYKFDPLPEAGSS
jgi:hypothetical protein